MNIAKITSNIPYYKYGSIQSKKKNPAQTKNTDLYCGYNSYPLYFGKFEYAKEQIQKRNYEKFISKEGRINPYTLKNLSKTTKDAYIQYARNSLKNNFCYLPKIDDISICAYDLKKYFDAQYGTNYRIISLGTSPSMIAEGMEYLGSDVVYLPVSGLSHAIIDDYGDSFGYSSSDMKLLMEYLKKKTGYIKNKKNIVLDYYFKGKTCRIVTSNIKSYFRMPKDLITQCNIMEALKEIQTKNIGKAISYETISRLETDMFKGNMEDISNVPHFYLVGKKYENLTTHSNTIKSYNKPKKILFREFDNYSNKVACEYYIVLSEALDKLDKNKKNPVVSPGLML